MFGLFFFSWRLRLPKAINSPAIGKSLVILPVLLRSFAYVHPLRAPFCCIIGICDFRQIQILLSVGYIYISILEFEGIICEVYLQSNTSARRTDCLVQSTPTCSVVVWRTSLQNLPSVQGWMTSIYFKRGQSSNACLNVAENSAYNPSSVIFALRLCISKLRTWRRGISLRKKV